MSIIKKKHSGTSYTDFFVDMAQYPIGNYEIIIVPLGEDNERNKRTVQQNRYLWGTVYRTLLPALRDVGYEFATLKEVHTFCKDIFQTRTVNKHTGETIDIPNSTRQMDTVVFATYLQVIREWAQEYLLVDIPDPTK